MEIIFLFQFLFYQNWKFGFRMDKKYEILSKICKHAQP